MFCKNCGSEVSETAYICPSCGDILDEREQTIAKDPDSPWWSFFSFFLPLIGLCLMIRWQQNRPRSARRCRNGIFAFLGVCAFFLAAFFLTLIVMAVLGMVR